MNKYETRAEAVINKKQAYMAKRKKRIRGITTAVASVTCAAVACAAVFVFRSSLDSANNNPTLIPVSTQAQEKPSGYDGKKIYIFDEEENYGDFKTCYINENNEENPYSELNRFGVLGVSGELAVPPIYDRALAAGENCFIVEKEGTNGYKISLRSNDYVNVADICLMFNGGGHVRAAGGNIKLPLEEAKQRVRSAIKNLGLDFPINKITINNKPINFYIGKLKNKGISNHLRFIDMLNGGKDSEVEFNFDKKTKTTEKTKI